MQCDPTGERPPAAGASQGGRSLTIDAATFGPRA
jgi:hypothetical protein